MYGVGMHPLSSSPAQTGSPLNLHQDRRRRARQKTYLPARVALRRNPSAQHRIVDLSEDGMSIQASGPLELRREEEFSIILSDDSEGLYAAGQLVWYNDSQQIGIQFTEMPDQARHTLREWLVANAFAADTEAQQEPRRHISAMEQMEGAAEEVSAEEEPQADYTTLLSALAVVRKEVDGLGGDLDAALHLIARRTQAFTRASGCAIALLEGAEVICRATAGSNTPPVGAPLRADSGFSGECLRSGQLARCVDSEVDPRADRDSCRALKIRSMLAVPIHRDGTIVGLLEVFAREPDAFGSEMELVFLQLSELASRAVGRASAPASVEAAPPVPVDDEFPMETPADLFFPNKNGAPNLLLIGAAVTVGFVIVWLAGPWSTTDLPAPGRVQSASVVAMSSARPTNSLDTLRKLAQQGDPAAEFSLGTRYALGQQVTQDYVQAARWFLSAAEQGNVAAQTWLSSQYEAGRGVPRSLTKAYYWALLGKAGGDAGSKAKADSLQMRLTPDDVSSVQQQAQQWIKQHNLQPASPPSS